MDYFTRFDCLELLFERMLLISLVGMYPYSDTSTNRTYKDIPCWKFDSLLHMYVTFLLASIQKKHICTAFFQDTPCDTAANMNNGAQAMFLCDSRAFTVSDTDNACTKCCSKDTPMLDRI